MDKKKEFKGLWAVILGGSGGFGLAAIEKIAHHGMNIAVLYRETAIADRQIKETFKNIAYANNVTILPFNTNALDADARASFIKNFSEAVNEKHNVKMLLHSIARGNLKPLSAGDNPTGTNDQQLLTVEDIQFTTYAMSNSLLDWTRDLLKAELFHPDARIIGLTSEGAHKYWEGYAAVSIAKSSLESLAKYMAVEFAQYGIKTNLIQAGITNTASLKMIPGSEKLVEIAGSRNPMRRITKPNDVAGVIYLLCTDEAFWINGAIIHADGGEHCL